MENDPKIKIRCKVCDSNQIAFFVCKNGFNLYRCAQCSLKFVYPVPNVTDQIYSSDYFSGAEKGFGYVSYDEDKEAMREVFLSYLDKIESITKNKGKLLDIGAANGYFLGLAKSRGWDVCGVEISEYAANQARQNGFDVITGTMKDAKISPNSLDVVTMWDVIEHFIDPVAEMNMIVNILKPGGLLIVNTPDGNSLFARILGSKWHQLIPPEHLFYFNPYALVLFLKKYNLKPIVCSKIGKKFTLQYVSQIASNWQNMFRWLPRLLKGTSIGNITLPINLYDNFFMIFQKN